MVAQKKTADTPHETPQGVRKFMDETKEQIEKVWSQTFSQLNARFQEREQDVREFLSKLELDGRKRFDTLSHSFRDQIKVDELFTKFKSSDFVEQGSKLGEEWVEQGLKVREEAIERMGLVHKADLELVTAELAKMTKKLESVRKKASTAPTKKSVEALVKRIATLEKAVASK